MRPILPSLKERNRYIVYEVKERKGFDLVKSKIEDSISKFFGDFESAKANILILDDFKDNKGIIKTNAKYVDKVKVALMLMKDPVVEAVGVSGTIKKARLNFMGG
ncbi:hypothetical protein J4425_02965 [Candidatus Woesearchaeota archaeon]|nr:hypothetical protein [Candidatus Woesearchaeota archaeon]